MLASYLSAVTTAPAGLRSVSRREITLLAGQFVLIAMTGTTVAGTNGTWINTTSGGLWSVASNWAGGTIANGTDGIADFSTLDITADDTVHLDSARTIGQLKFGDTVPSNNWILDNNGNAANTLTMAVSSGSPQITVNNEQATINLSLEGSNLSGAAVVVNGPGTLVLGGTTDNTGLGITVNSGTVILAKTSSGSPNDVHAVGGPGLTINGGTAQLGGTGGDQIYDIAPVTITSGAFDTNGRSETFATLNLQGTGIGGVGALVNSAAAFSVITPTGGTTLTGTTVIGVTQSTGELQLNNAIGGNFGLGKTGSGTLLLAGNNTFSGGSVVGAGTLALGNAGALGSNAVSVNDGATLDLGGQAIGANRLIISRTGVGGNGALINSSTAAASFAGTVTANGPFTVGGTGDITLSGSVDGGNEALTKIGNNTLTLSGTTDNNSLAVTVDSGTVVLAKTSSGSPNDVHAIGQDMLTVNGGTAQLGGTGGDQIYDLGSVTVISGTFDTNGRNETFATLNLQGTGIGGVGALVNSAAAFSAITPTGGTTLTGNATIGVTQSTGELQLNNAIGVNFALTKVGAGTLVLTGNPTLNANSSLLVNGGTLRFNALSGAATIGTGVTAAVNNSATLELAGTVSALGNGSGRVNITNNSSAAAGILVSGTHQIVGNIDGSGTTQVNAGSDLMANHIVQSALVIGGAVGSPAVVTIDASDASGNPLVGPALPTPPDANAPLALGAELGDSLNVGLVAGNLPSLAASDSAAVPEPSSLFLLAVGGLALGAPSVRKRLRRRADWFQSCELQESSPAASL